LNGSGVDGVEPFRNEGGFFRIEGRAWFRLGGTDRIRYLNGQVSNDVRKLTPGTAMQACVLSVKGKLDAVVWMWAMEDGILVECDAEIAEPLGMRLEKYIVADDVTVEQVEPNEELHVFGPAADLMPGDVVLRRMERMGVPGVDVPAKSDFDLPRECSGELRELLRIERGIPAWGRELNADTLPAEAGLDATAVDFHKGCYIGQEVVSRIRSVGHANRTLEKFVVESGEIPAAGAELFLPGEFEGRPAGVVTSSLYHFGLSRGAGLCYIKRGIDLGASLETAKGSGATRIKLRPFLPCELS